MPEPRAIDDRGAVLGTMTCQTCGKVFLRYRHHSPSAFADMLDAHLERHRLVEQHAASRG